jgi:hypothetical protein
VTRSARSLVALLVAASAAGLVLSACTNDPFDPSSVPNEPPTLHFFVEPIDPDQELNPTSYFSRTFHWSGSDRDGTVDEYYVSVRLDPDVPAPWDTTTRTDTTMTFTTDDNGEARAVFHLACRDDQGAYSDTLITDVPLRNFPPVLNFQSDFEPLKNMQREITAEGDTLYWNWGVMNARCFAFDLDGTATMDTFYRYTFAADPVEVYAWDDPAADPRQHWLAVPFAGQEDIHQFNLLLTDVPPGQRTLTIAVSDEADAESRLTLDWEVRAPSGPVLMVGDNSGPATRNFYRGFLDGYFGEGVWDEYDFWFGLPDNETILLETLRLFDVVFWFDGGGTSTVLEQASRRDGVLQQYVHPFDASDPGRLLMISRNLTGTDSGISTYFRQEIFGVNPAADPAPELRPRTAGMPILGQDGHLPDMTLQTILGRGRGMKPRFDEPDTAYDELYRFEECARCFFSQPVTSPPTYWSPLIGVRRPQRAVQPLASAVGFSFELHVMQQAGAYAALAAVFEHELGLVAP